MSATVNAKQGEQRPSHLLGQEPLQLEGVARVPADPELVALDPADEVAQRPERA